MSVASNFAFLASPDMCIASAISLLMILICGMATYGAYKVTYLFDLSVHTCTMLLIETKCTVQIYNDWTDCIKTAGVESREPSSVDICNNH